MSSVPFFIDALASAVEPVKRYLDRECRLVAVGALGPEYVVYNRFIETSKFIIGGVHICHGATMHPAPWFSGCVVPASSDPMYESLVIREMMETVFDWMRTRVSGKRDVIPAGVCMLTVRGVKYGPETVQMLKDLLVFNVPVSVRVTPPCAFEVELLDGRIVDIFQLHAVVEQWLKVRAA